MKSPLHRGLALTSLIFLVGTPAWLAAAPMRVLFLGNSLTDGNNVPGLVQAMARLQGVDLEYTAIAPGNYAIEDHWSDRRQLLLETGNYGVLVLQQGPSTLPESQAHLRQWTITWAAESRRHGTRPALYMVWPVRTQANGFALVSQSYRNAALAADAAVFPAGEAWEQVLRADPSITLYSSDNLHATPAGSFLAAMVIGRGLFSLDPTRVPATVDGITVPAATLAQFHAAVASLPAATLTDTPLPASGSTPVQSGDTPNAGNPPSASSSGAGGGAPSLWFLAALLAAGTARRMQSLKLET